MAAQFSREDILRATAAVLLQSGLLRTSQGVCTDTRALLPNSLFVALVGERFDGHAFLNPAAQSGAAGLVVQKSRAPHPLPAGIDVFEVADTLGALGQLARFHRNRFDIPVGAVTGSNGKTTTKEMVAAILSTRGPALATQGNLNNEVGVPLTLFRLDTSHVAAVIEMGMNHPGEISRLTAIARPQAGLITSVQAAHLKGLGSLEGVANAKGELFLGLDSNATAVVNLDAPLIVAQAQKTRAHKLTFGRTPGADIFLEQVQSQGDAGLRVFIRADGRIWEIPLSFVGAHNALNAAGAFALGRALGYAPEACVQGLSTAKPYERRLNVLKTPEGLTVLDDCYNANPASMLAALETLQSLTQKKRAVAVLGDMLELGDVEVTAHRELGARAGQTAELVAFFGPLSLEGHRASGLGDRSAHFRDVEPLLAWLRPRLTPHDVVLVKGSRGMKLERVVQALVPSSGAGGH